MPKLSKAAQKQTEAAEGGSFDPLEPGVYHVRLVNVDGSKEGPAGPYWSWEFGVVEEGGRGKLWNNTSLSEAAAFKMKETFGAFGADLDTDTDDLVGQVVRATVSIRTIQSGARKGEQANQIDRLSPPDPEFKVGVAAEKEEQLDI